MTFKKMKGLNNDQLPEYVNLQHQIVKYLSTPSYNNYFKVHDKKLTKNTIKRCVVDPFCEKFMKVNDSKIVEIARHLSQP
jgi:deoxyhypusine synthase